MQEELVNTDNSLYDLRVAQLVKLLDSFPYNIDKYIGNNSYFIVDDHVELAKYLIDNGVGIQRWIPITERRPTDSTDTDESRGWGCVEVYSPATGVDVASTTWVNEFENDITHWRPLPDPPYKIVY